MLRHNKELKAEISVVTKEDYVAIIKVIEQKISIATKNFSIAIENGRDMRTAKTSLSRQRFQCCNKQFNQRQSSKNKICCDIFRVCHDIEFSLNSVSQQDSVAKKKKYVGAKNPCYYEKLLRSALKEIAISTYCTRNKLFNMKGFFVNLIFIR